MERYQLSQTAPDGFRLRAGTSSTPLKALLPLILLYQHPLIQRLHHFEHLLDPFPISRLL
jgi:hypothetical protein